MQVASIVGIARSTLYRYERDEVPCRNPDVLRRLSRLYQVTERYLEEGEEIPGGESLKPLPENEILHLYREAALRNQIRVSGILRDQHGKSNEAEKNHLNHS